MAASGFASVDKDIHKTRLVLVTLGAREGPVAATIERVAACFSWLRDPSPILFRPALHLSCTGHFLLSLCIVRQLLWQL